MSKTQWAYLAVAAMLFPASVTASPGGIEAMEVMEIAEAARLLPPSMASPVPDVFFKFFLLITFFMHLVLVNILLGSALLAIFDRRSSASSELNGVAFMPKVLALAVNFGIAPFLFLQVIYGSFLYPGIVLMAVWWLAIPLFAMLAYYGLYVSDGTVKPTGRMPVLVPTVLLLLMLAFLLTNVSTLMQRPDLWFAWLSDPRGTILNIGDPTLLPRYLHIILASLAVGGLVITWRAALSKRRPKTDGMEADRRMRRGLDWFFYASLAQIPTGLLFLFTLPQTARGLFLGGSVLPTAALLLALFGLSIALILAWRGGFKSTTAVVLGVILTMICVRDMARDAMLQPFTVFLEEQGAPEALTMPLGQPAALGLFLASAVLVAVVVIWLARAALRAFPLDGPEIRED